MAHLTTGIIITLITRITMAGMDTVTVTADTAVTADTGDTAVMVAITTETSGKRGNLSALNFQAGPRAPAFLLIPGLCQKFPGIQIFL